MFGFGSSRRFQSYRDPHPWLRKLFRLLKFALLVFVLHGVITSFLLVSYKIESISMEPSYEPGARIAASPLLYGPKIPLSEEHFPGLTNPKRGDLVVLRTPFYADSSFFETLSEPFLHLLSFKNNSFSAKKRELWENEFVIKRIIALPGDSVRIKNLEAFVKPKGTPDFVSEFSLSLSRYDIQKIPGPKDWKETDPFGGFVQEVVLAEDEYFVLGDNRARSTDSRLWGPVKEQALHAKVLFRYWPFTGNKRS